MHRTPINRAILFRIVPGLVVLITIPLCLKLFGLELFPAAGAAAVAGLFSLLLMRRLLAGDDKS